MDRRTPEQKEADKQNAADGKDGRCGFRFEDGYYCKHKGFVCVDGRKCDDRRTDSQRWEDDRLERLREDKKEAAIDLTVSRDNRALRPDCHGLQVC